MSCDFEKNLLELSKSLDIKIAIKEWQYLDREFKGDDGIQCLCSHTLHKGTIKPNINIYINNTNSNTLTVGNSCVKKFGERTKKTKKHIKNMDYLRDLCGGGKYIAIEDCLQYSEEIKEWIIKTYIDNGKFENIIPFLQMLIKYNSQDNIENFLEGIEIKSSPDIIEYLIILLENEPTNTIFNDGMNEIIEKLKVIENTKEIEEERRKALEIKRERKRKEIERERKRKEIEIERKRKEIERERKRKEIERERKRKEIERERKRREEHKRREIEEKRKQDSCKCKFPTFYHCSEVLRCITCHKYPYNIGEMNYSINNECKQEISTGQSLISGYFSCGSSI